MAVVKAKGVKLGNPLGAKVFQAYRAQHGNKAAREGATRAANEFAANLRPILAAMIGKKLNNAQIADALNAKGVPTRREGAKWYETSVKNIRERLAI